MKKIFLVITLACSLALLTSCGSSSGKNATRPAATANNPAVNSQTTVSVPGRNPEMAGKVKEIIGNEVTMFTAKIGTEPGSPAPQRQERPANATNQRQGAPEQNADGRSSTSGGARRDMSAGQGMGAGISFTEETLTFIIPVGTPIATMQRGGNATATAQLTDIKKDQMIRVWKAGETVEFVQLLGGNRTGVQQQQQGGGGNRAAQGGPPAGMGGVPGR